MLTKYIKNITTENLPVLNRDLEPSEIWQIPAKLWSTLYEDEQIVIDLLAGNVEISSDGLTPLNYNDSIDLIQQFQIITDTGGPENFSYKRITNGMDVTVPGNQEMLVSQEFNMEDTGNITLDGDLTIFDIKE